MIKRRIVVLSVDIAATLSVPSVAQTWTRKPGLWEVEYSVSGTHIPSLDDRWTRMSPAQRARADEAMRRQGMSVGVAPNTMRMRVCLTPAQVAQHDGPRDVLGKLAPNSECQHKVIARSATEMRFTGVCRNKDGGTTQIEGRVYESSPEHYAAEWHSRSSTKGKIRMRQNARWLGSDCGSMR